MRLNNYLKKNPLAGEFLEYLNEGNIIFVMVAHSNFYKLPEVKIGKNIFEAETFYELDNASFVINSLDDLVRMKVLEKQECDPPQNYGVAFVYKYPDTTRHSLR